MRWLGARTGRPTRAPTRSSARPVHARVLIEPARSQRTRRGEEAGGPCAQSRLADAMVAGIKNYYRDDQDRLRSRLRRKDGGRRRGAVLSP